MTVRILPLRDLLISSRVGITTSRFISDPQAESIRIIKNHDLNPSDAALTIDHTEPQIHCLHSLIPTDTLLKHQLHQGDVLASLKFIQFWTTCVGNEPDSVPCYASNNIAVLIPNSQLMLSKYLTLWLRSDGANQQITQLADQTTKTGKSFGRNFSVISLTRLLQIKVPVPSLSKQAQLVQEYEDILQFKRECDRQVEHRHTRLKTQIAQFESARSEKLD